MAKRDPLKFLTTGTRPLLGRDVPITMTIEPSVGIPNGGYHPFEDTITLFNLDLADLPLRWSDHANGRPWRVGWDLRANDRNELLISFAAHELTHAYFERGLRTSSLRAPTPAELKREQRADHFAQEAIAQWREGRDYWAPTWELGWVDA